MLPIRYTRCLSSLVVALQASLLVSACSSQKRADAPEDKTGKMSQIGSQTSPSETSESEVESSGPKRIIFMVGDGMGAPAMTAGTYARGRPLRMLSMEQWSFITTHSYEFVTTDSAASATAFATGHKTHYEGLSVEPGTTQEQQENEEYHLTTVLELAESRGWKTGLVSTSRVVHATPAAFASHRANRHTYDAIAEDMTQSGVDVLLGGGRKHFTEQTEGETRLEAFEASGYRIAETADDVKAASGVAERLIGLVHDSYLPPAGSGEREMSLPRMTREAIEVLDRNNDEGFFLMVEGSQIDWAEHDIDGPQTIAETRDFDRAVGVALEYARDREDTLVVTVADHETGGLAVLDPDDASRYTDALGGRGATEDRVDYPASIEVDEEVPDAVSTVSIGGDTSETNDDGDDLGIRDLDDDVLATSFGYLSVATRPHRSGPDDFWSTHTPEMIPMLAEGPGATWMTRASDNAEVGKHLKALVRGERRTTTADHRASNSSGDAPRNVVLLIGEGLGFDAWTSAYYSKGPLNARACDERGVVATHGSSSLVADDAAAATALAVGERTFSGHLGSVRTEDGVESRRTILERAEARGLRTGLVTDGSLFNPTLAAMYAHGRTKQSVASASSDHRIAVDPAEAFVTLPDRIEGADGVDLAYGEADSLDEEVRNELSSQGVAIERGWGDISSTQGRHLRVLDSPRPSSEMTTDDSETAPTLAERTRTALDKLSKEESGFLLVVESEDIGTAQKQLARDGRIVEEVEAFDRAVGAARDFAERQGRTLVIATADRDHSLSTLDNHYGFSDEMCDAVERCGGDVTFESLSVATGEIEGGEGLSDTSLQGEYAPPTLLLQYAWLVQEAARHHEMKGTATANFVPLFADGPWSQRFEGFVDQPEIGEILETWVTSNPREP